MFIGNMKIYIAMSDGRERSHDPILGVYKKESDAYARLGKYAREHNTVEEMTHQWLIKPIEEMTDEELGKTQLNQWSCSSGSVLIEELR
jgi:hypothetical protein